MTNAVQNRENTREANIISSSDHKDLEKRFRDAARSCRKFTDYKEKLSSKLAFSDEAFPSQRDKEVEQVCGMRFDVARRLKEVINLEVSLSNKIEKKKAQQAKRDLLDELNSLPDLGFTIDEWMDFSEGSDSDKNPVGRPKLPFEVEYLRAQSDLENQYSAYRKLSDELGNPYSSLDNSLSHPMSMDDMLRVYERSVKNMGRKPLDELGYLDTRIRSLNEKIEYIKSGQAEEDRRQKALKRKNASGGPGRPFKDLGIILSECESEKEDLVSRLSELESKLSPSEHIDRAIKIKKDEIHETRRKIRSKGWNPKTSSPEGMPYKDDLDRLNFELSSLKESKDRVGELEGDNSCSDSSLQESGFDSDEEKRKTIGRLKEIEDNRRLSTDFSSDLDSLEKEIKSFAG